MVLARVNYNADLAQQLPTAQAGIIFIGFLLPAAAYIAAAGACARLTSAGDAWHPLHGVFFLFYIVESAAALARDAAVGLCRYVYGYASVTGAAAASQRPPPRLGKGKKRR